GAFDPRGHRQVDRHRLQRSGLRFGLRQRGPRLVGRDTRIFAGRPPAVDGQLGQPADLAGQILDGGAGSPVDVGRVLAGEDRDLGYGATWTFKPLPDSNASIAAVYSSSPNRLVIMASQS